MIVVAGLGIVVAAALAVAVVRLGRERQAVLERLERLAARFGVDSADPLASPLQAVARIDAVLEAREERSAATGPAGRYLTVLHSIPLGVVLVDEAGEALFVNDAAAWFRAGRHGEAVVAQAVDDLIARALLGTTVEETVQLYGPPRRHLHVTASAIEMEGRHRGALVVIDDVTEQERTDAIRRDFVSNISHELRTPIGAMSLLAETLVGERDEAVVESLATRLSREAERLAATVDDLLELSRIEHGGDDEFEPLVLQGVVAGAHDRVRAAAQQRNVEVGVNLPDADLLVLGDRRQLTSAVFNLLDNAVKYCGTSGGTVSIRARRVDDEIELIVQDSGIGIPRKDLDRVFERFYRVDRGRSRASGGTGLGLSMVRHIVVNHGGQISVDSVEGEGTTFTIELPAHVPGATEAADDAAAPVPSPPPGDDDRDDHEVTNR